jgi:hypothetical protein
MKKTVRNVMLVLGLGAFLAFGASACGGKEAKKAEALAKEACACKDKACAEGVLGKFKEFMIKNKDKKVSKKNAERAGKAAKKMTECMIKAGVERKTIAKTMMDIQKG